MPARNPYDVQGAASENRWRQPAAELFGPTPCSVAHVAISTGGKTSQMLCIADSLLPVMDRVVIFHILTASIQRLEPSSTKSKTRWRREAKIRKHTRTPSIICKVCPQSWRCRESACRREKIQMQRFCHNC